MATLASLRDRVRLELGDQGKSFVVQFMADGSTNRFEIGYSPVDAESLFVSFDGTNVSDDASIEERTGILVTDSIPQAGTLILVSGTHFRYFRNEDYDHFVNTAFNQHSHRRQDSLGREFTIETMPGIEEYPVALYASTLALYTLATDAAFDINVFAPDGVTIPRSERYRQLMEMIESRREQYKDLCVQLGLGIYQIEVFNMNRISKMTNRLIPNYRPMEVDDKSMPLRIDTPKPTYGDVKEPWPSTAEQLLAYEGYPFTHTKTFTGDYTGKVFQANLLNQRGSTYRVRPFELVVVNPELVGIDSVSRTAGTTTVTVTTDEGHGLTQGQSIFIWGINDDMLKSFEVSEVTDGTTFTFETPEETSELAITDSSGYVEPYGEKDYTVTFSLGEEETRKLARRTWWSLAYKDAAFEETVVINNVNVADAYSSPSGPGITELFGGNFYTERANEAVL